MRKALEYLCLMLCRLLFYIEVNLVCARSIALVVSQINALRRNAHLGQAAQNTFRIAAGAGAFNGHFGGIPL